MGRGNMQEFIKINKEDKTAVALCPLTKGTELDIDGERVTLLEDIPQGHKFALCDMAPGEAVIKYGHSIGNAQTAIKKGSWIHSHNLKTGLGDLLEYDYVPVEPMKRTERKASFLGFKRSDGKTGVRNELWILPTVGCVNSVAKAIEAEAKNVFI